MSNNKTMRSYSSKNITQQQQKKSNNSIYVFNPDSRYTNKLINYSNKGKFITNILGANKSAFEENSSNKGGVYITNPNAHKFQQFEQNLQSNPFWAPKNNSGLFDLRELKKKEQDIKKLIKRHKSAIQGDLDNLHKENLKYKAENLLYLKTLSNFRNLYNESANDNSNITNNSFYNTNTYFNKTSNTYNINKANNINNTPSKNRLDPISLDSNSALSTLRGNAHMLSQMDIQKNKEKDIQKDEMEKIDKLLKQKIDRINIHDNSVKSFIDKTRDLIKLKYGIKVKQEREQRLKETYENELESIKDTIFSMKQAKKLFEENFLIKFEEYVKYCLNQKEKEKKYLNDLRESRIQIEMKIKEKENYKFKLLEKRRKYEEYRNFLICIKEKILMTGLDRLLAMKDDVYLTEIEKQGSKQIIDRVSGLDKKSSMISHKMNPSNHNLGHLSTFSNHHYNQNNNHTSNSNFNNSLTSKLYDHSKTNLNNINSITHHAEDSLSASRQVSNHSISIKSIALEEMKKRILNYIKNPKSIFNSSEELIDELKALEKENINKILKYNEMSSKIREINNENQGLKKNFDFDTKNVIISIKQKEDLLNELKRKNSELIKEKRRLISGETIDDYSGGSNFKSSKTNNYSGLSSINNINSESNQSNAIYSKISNIFSLTQQIPVFADKKKELIMNSHSGLTNYNNNEKDYISMMSIIENSLDFLIERNNVYLRSGEEIEKRYKKKIEALDQEKKIRASEKQKQMEIQKMEKLKISIQERNNRIYIRNKREITKRYKPKGSVKIKNEIIKTKGDLSTFEELISYGNEFISNNK